MSAEFFAPLRARAEAFWHARNAGERRLLRIALWFALPTVLVFGLLLPLRDRVAVLERQIPALRLQAAAVRAMHDELAALPAAARTAPEDATRRQPAAIGVERLRARIDARVAGFSGTLGGNPNGFELAIEHAPFNALLQWLAEVQRDEALFVVEARFSALEPDGSVAGRVLLAHGGGN